MCRTVPTTHEQAQVLFYHIYTNFVNSFSDPNEQAVGQDGVNGAVDFGLENEGDARSSIVNLRMRAKEHSISLVGWHELQDYTSAIYQ